MKIVESDSIGAQDANTSISTGFGYLDALIGGFQKENLIVIAARPGMGTTALALNFAGHSGKLGHSTLIFSLEVPPNQLILRMLSAEARVDISRLHKGDLSQEELSRIKLASQTIANQPVGFEESALGMSLMELRSRCLRWKENHGLGMVIVDYFQLLSDGSKNSSSRERELLDVSRGLKVLAKELRVPVIVLTQLGCGPESRVNHRPKCSDLREFGCLESDADMILFLSRDENYNTDSEDKNTAEITVAKNRNGGIGAVRLAYHSSFITFYHLINSIDQ